MTPAQYLDAAKAKLGIESDYAIAQRLDVPRQYVSEYRLGKRWPDVAALVRLAVILELDPAEVITDVESQHTKDAKKAAFLRDFASRAHGAGRHAVRTLGWIFIAAWLAVGATGSNGESRFKRRLSCA